MADSTTINVYASDSTTLRVSSGDATTVTTRNAEATILNAIAASISVPENNLSDDTPLELSDTGSAGTSLFAARADHRHPSTGMSLNGGNF